MKQLTDSLIIHVFSAKKGHEVMNVNELTGILNGYFSWNKSRMECFTTMLIALIKVRTVNLTEIACGFSSTATQDSRYIRIKRFFREFQIDFSVVAAWVIQFFGLSGLPLHLSMERYALLHEMVQQNGHAGQTTSHLYYGE